MLIAGLAGRKVMRMDLFDIVTRLVGPVQPIGETYADDARLDNLKKLTELTERLLAEIRQAASCADRPEASMSKAGKYAKDFLDEIVSEWQSMTANV